MSFQTNIRALYSNFIFGHGSGFSGHSYVTFPTTGKAQPAFHGTANTFGDYVTLISTIGTSEAWMVGANFAVPSAVPANNARFAFATGASGSETDRGVIPWADQVLSTPNAERVMCVHINLPFPLHIPSATRTAVRGRSDSTSTATVDVVQWAATSLK